MFGSVLIYNYFYIPFLSLSLSLSLSLFLVMTNLKKFKENTIFLQDFEYLSIAANVRLILIFNINYKKQRPLTKYRHITQYYTRAT